MNDKLKFFIKNLLNFDLDNDFIFIKDKNLNYIYANEKFCHLFNTTLSELLGKNDTFLMTEPETISKCKESDIFALNSNFFISNEIVSNIHYRVLKLKINLDNNNYGILCLARNE